jgi:predicted  nucleic acid-binding Zn-ribbon protein
MSIGVCRVQKVSGAGNVTGCQIHNRREREHSNTNPDIDFTQSMKNFSLLEKTNKPYNVLIDERLKVAYKGKRAVRKDAVKMCEMLFTSDNLFFEQLSSTEIKKYFEECYNFACERYGRENIISAVVHLDETTPHLHLDFVPLTADGRLSAKEILGVKTDLQKLQDDFYNQVSSKYGLERGNRADLSTGEPTAKHFTTQEYKLKTAKDKLQQAEKELAETKKLVEQSSEALQALQGRVLAQQEVNALKGKKTLTGGLRGISYTDYLSLKKTASYVDKAKSKVKRLETEKDELTEQIKQLHSDLQEAKTARFGYIMQQKNTLVKEIEEKYKKYVF